MMKRLLRALVAGIARGVAALLLLALLLPVALVLYTTTDDFRSRLLERLVPELDSRIAGELSIESLEGSPLSALRFQNVALAWHGEEIARIETVSIALDWPALLAGRWRVSRLDLESPRAVFREHATLGWDWRDALAPLIRAPGDPRPPGAEPLPVVIERLSVRAATLRVEPRDRPAITLEGVELEGAIDFTARQLSLDRVAYATGASKLVARGKSSFEGRYAFEVALEALDPRDLGLFSPAIAESLSILPAATGALRLQGDKEHVEAGGQLDWADAKLVFEAHGNPRDLALSSSTIEARLEASELTRFLPDSPLAGRLEAELELDRGKGKLRGALRPAPRGELTARGSFSLGELPEAKIRFAGRDFDPARAVREHPEWAGSLTGDGVLRVRGRRRDDLTASLEATLRESRVGELEIRRGALRAKLAGEAIDLAELAVDSPIGRVRASGRLSTKPGGPLSLEGLVDVDDLGPLLALARRQGEGALRGRIALEGRTEKAHVTSELELADFRLDELRIERARLAFDTRGRLMPDIDTRVDSADLETAFGRWTLEQPARLRASRDGLDVGSARFASGEARIALDGHLARSGAQDFRLEARALPLAEWARAFPERLPPGLLSSGALDLDLAVGGTAAAPTLDLRLEPRALVLSDKPIDEAEARLRVAARMAHATLSASASPALRLEAEVQLPFELHWTGDLVARPLGELVAHAEGEANDLAIAKPFLAGQVDKLGGRARARLELAGPLDALRPSGELTVTGLTGRLRRAGVTVVSGDLAVELAADRFRLRRATATAAGHEDTARFRADGEGPLPAFLARFVPSASEHAGDYTTKVEVERWPLVETRSDRLIASGVLTAHGSLEAPRVEGRIEIVEGTLRPDLTFLSSGPPPRDPTIEYERDEPNAEGGGARGARSRKAPRGPNVTALLEALELAVTIDVGRDLWVKHEQAEVLLEGRVEARKRARKRLSLDGRIEAQQGFAKFQQRHFRLIEGSLELVGGAKIDPNLDVLARHKAPEYLIDARLTGTASKPVLTLSSDPELSQEDILAVLLFGRPASELSQEQQTSVGQRAEQMASSLGITAVGRTVASALGLEAMGLQIEELSQERARVGAYVGRKIFVALSQEFSGEQGQELSIEYEFWPGWSVVGSTTSEGTNSADLVWKFRY